MSTAVESLGLTGLEAIHYYVHDLERSREFYTKRFDFAHVGESDAQLTRAGKQKSNVFEAGQIRVIVSTPDGEGGRAWRWLQKFPDGVGTLIFTVKDIDRAFYLLDQRGGTPIDEIQTITDEFGTFRTFSITTPFGGSTFRFIDRSRYKGLYPGIVRYGEAKGGRNKYGFEKLDHVTSNFETMSPALLWMQHVMGFTPFWNIEFHTTDVADKHVSGSGLRSRVMWDPSSGAKFANNEPLRPFFKKSQINIFCEDQHGSGIQHVALTVKDMIPAVKSLRASGVEFMPTPGSYYDMLPERLKKIGVNQIEEDIGVLRGLEILVDGEAERSYMLQIFLKDSASLYKQAKAGPFFYEIIQRKGDQGFGGGNFRALFESIEREQVQAAQG